MLIAIIPYFLKFYLKEIIKLLEFYLDNFIKNLYNKINLLKLIISHLKNN